MVEERSEVFKGLVNMFLDALIINLDAVPYGIRWLCKTIKELTKLHFPEATEENIISLVGGFFLLRFVNPAIVTPDVGSARYIEPL